MSKNDTAKNMISTSTSETINSQFQYGFKSLMFLFVSVQRAEGLRG
jgi:hypothetical protein